MRPRPALAFESELTELHGVGPFIAQQLRAWIEKPPAALDKLPHTRRDFLALADAKVILAAKPAWTKSLRGDLQMHTRWLDSAALRSE